MFKKERLQSAGIAVLGLLLWFGCVQTRPAEAQTSNDAKIQAQVQKALDKKQFNDVHAAVQNGNVTLQGTVPLYQYKEDADNRAHHVQGVHGVDNLIEVAGQTMSDEALRNKLSEKLSYVRVGYGTTAFNAFTLEVRNGVVTLGGTAYGPIDKDDALGIVENTPGVRDVIDNIQVAPLSSMDDRLRIELARTIYGTAQLNKYALNPAKPIRIIVVNGHVTLAGVVDSKSDSEIAALRANGVPGVFSVTNDLQVAGAQPGK